MLCVPCSAGYTCCCLPQRLTTPRLAPPNRCRETSASVAAEVTKRRSQAISAAECKRTADGAKPAAAAAGQQNGNAGGGGKADTQLLVASLKRKMGSGGGGKPAAAAGGKNKSKKPKF